MLTTARSVPFSRPTDNPFNFQAVKYHANANVFYDQDVIAVNMYTSRTKKRKSKCGRNGYRCQDAGGIFGSLCNRGVV